MQKTAYVLRISDWCSDVCSSDLDVGHGQALVARVALGDRVLAVGAQAHQHAAVDLGHQPAGGLAHPAEGPNGVGRHVLVGGIDGGHASPAAGSQITTGISRSVWLERKSTRLNPST